jgi:hypothetical protein
MPANWCKPFRRPSSAWAVACSCRALTPASEASALATCSSTASLIGRCPRAASGYSTRRFRRPGRAPPARPAIRHRGRRNGLALIRRRFRHTCRENGARSSAAHIYTAERAGAPTDSPCETETAVPSPTGVQRVDERIVPKVKRDRRSCLARRSRPADAQVQGPVSGTLGKQASAGSKNSSSLVPKPISREPQADLLPLRTGQR